MNALNNFNLANLESWNAMSRPQFLDLRFHDFTLDKSPEYAKLSLNFKDLKTQRLRKRRKGGPMKTKPVRSHSTHASIMNNADSPKLLSLFALAGAALAMPQSSNADIIVTDLSTPVSVLGELTSSFLVDNLPGTARLAFQGRVQMNPAMMMTTHSVRASQRAGYVRFKTDAASFVVAASAGLTWNQIPGVSSVNGYAAVANQNGHAPDSFDHKYMAFKFKDSTVAGSPLRYGWIDYSVANATAGVPVVTIFRYAFDDTGATIPTGVVPEPAPTALLALGALVLGAKGVRAWRRRAV